MTTGHALPKTVFLLASGALIAAALSLVIMRRRATVLLLCAVFLIGCWRGWDAVITIEQEDRFFVSVLDNFLDGLRLNIATSLSENIGEDRSGLPIALLIGDRSGISPRVTSDFRSAGLAHLLAISGLHVSLVGGSMMAFAIFAFGRKHYLHLLLPLATVIFYAALAGFAPPVTRAAIMFSVFILGSLMGRGSHTLAALALAATLMVALQPAILASMSFQLSFTAMLGISFVSPALTGITEVAASKRSATESVKWLQRVRRFIVGSLAVSVASSLGTLPLIALHFDEVPIWGPIATLLAVPVVPMLIIFTAFVSALGGLPMPLVSEVVALPAIAATTYLEVIAEFFTRLPPRAIETGGWSVWMTVVYYSVAAIMITFWHQITSALLRLRLRLMGPGVRFVPAPNWNIGMHLVITSLLLLLGIGLWGMSFMAYKPQEYLSVRFLETTHGESMFIQSANGNRLLVDVGGERSQVAETLNSLLPFWDRDIDIVLLTHSDSDHVGGLSEVMNRFRVGSVIYSGTSAKGEGTSTLASVLKNHQDVVIAWTGMIIGIDQDVFVEVLSTGCAYPLAGCKNNNDASIVTMLRVGDISFLLTGDIERKAEIRLATTGPDLRATVLKAAHHGSNTSSANIFIDAVEPSVVVVAAGTQNRYGHPHPEVIERLKRAVGEERVFRTDLMGTVELRTDGRRLWVVR